MLFACTLNVLITLNLSSIIIGLSYFHCSIMFILFDSVYLNSFSIFLIHFCHMKLSFTINELEITRLRVKLCSFQKIFLRFVLIFINFGLFLTFIASFSSIIGFCVYFWLFFFFLSFKVGLRLIFLFGRGFLTFILSFLASFLIYLTLIKILHVPVKIFK